MIAIFNNFFIFIDFQRKINITNFGLYTLNDSTNDIRYKIISLNFIEEVFFRLFKCPEFPEGANIFKKEFINISNSSVFQEYNYHNLYHRLLFNLLLLLYFLKFKYRFIILYSYKCIYTIYTYICFKLVLVANFYFTS